MYIKLGYTRSSGIARGTTHAYGLSVEVVEADGVPTEIFVFQVNAPSNTDPQASAPSSQFVSVADPVDIAQYPVGAANLDNNMPYFRADKVNLVFRSIGELEECQRMLDSDVRELVDTLRALESGEGIREEVVYA